MVRRRTKSIPLPVDSDGIEIPACLRPPGDGRASYHVRWKEYGKWRTESTGTNVRFEAERIGRAIVRGERIAKAKCSGFLSLDEFIEVQQRHYAGKAVARKGQRSFQKFLGVWRGFLKIVPQLKSIQGVDCEVALRYVKHLKSLRRDANYAYVTKTETKLSQNTILSSVSALSAAWNRVRLGHGKAKSGIERYKMVSKNPWEEIKNDLPARTKRPIVQFDLGKGEFEALLDHFPGRETAQLFLIVSLWAVGRLEEVSEFRWDWIDGNGYVCIPDEIAKKGFGKVIRLPPSIHSRLKAVQVPGDFFVFARFADELQSFYRGSPKTEHEAEKVLVFSPARLRWRMAKHIRAWATGKNLAGFSHHAIRRTAMELSDEGELLALEKRSAEKLRTTAGNKRGSYLKRQTSKRHYLLADALFVNLSTSLREFPDLARRVGVEEFPPSEPSNILEIVAALGADEKRQLLQALVGEAFAVSPI